MKKRNWKGTTGAVVAILMGTSLLMSGQAYAASEKIQTYTTSQSKHSQIADKVISDGLKYKGVPYKFGSSSNTTKTFDCSSFTQRVFKQSGIILPRDSRQQSQVGKKVSKNQLQKGDLIFFRSSGSSSPRITHVAIYAGNNTLLHTYGKPGVTTTKFFGTSWEKRFEIARRVIS